MKKSFEVADVFRLYGKDYQKQNILSYQKLKVMNHISVCRTAQLGGVKGHEKLSHLWSSKMSHTDSFYKSPLPFFVMGS
ncbi:hypothetical protein [Desulfotignum balticum]|uniref:hypothetical protein n=1 Tax=Desulfotignum balticum TaxID=115781 RepID=UPI000422E8E6|nr:hypothetical protein [Desulfotignum balticum]